MTQLIGFIGLGIMGFPMAKNLLKSGYSVIGYNRSEHNLKELVNMGGVAAKNPKEVAEKAQIIITCLPNSKSVLDVVFQKEGLIDGFQPESILIDCSTISPKVTIELSKKLSNSNISLLDAPISGGEEGAIKASLSIMVGGSKKLLECHMDLFLAMGETITHCGENGSGQIAKACNQIVVAAQMVGVSEALLLAKKSGADIEAVVSAISGGAASCWTLSNRAPDMIRGNFEPGFFAEYQYKDLKIATDAGREFGSPMPQTMVAHELYKSMVETGMGRDGNSGVLKILQLLAGTKARIE
jgi:2-hydroxy-3-oxopropionate reductase